MTDFVVCSWPTEQVNEALVALAQTAGVGAHAAESAQQAPANLSRERLGAWVEAAARALGLEATPFAVTYSEVELVLARAAPALLLFEREPGQMAFLSLSRGGTRTLALLGPDQSVRILTVTEVAQALRQAVERPMVAEVDPILDMLRVDPKRRGRAKALLMADRMRDRPVALVFVLAIRRPSAFGGISRPPGRGPRSASCFLATL